MFWCDGLISKISDAQVINDSKTPSGRVHVGSLRGVIIHDAVYRLLRQRNIPVRYIYGVDDYDPLDEIPDGMDEHFREHLGKPLCNVPAPPGSSHNDMAAHYISEFFDVFRQLRVDSETYRMRDMYRSGQFNEAIDRILSHAADVRSIYQSVSKSIRPENWHPFQIICERCGKIGTTEVTSYNGKTAAYTCRPDLVAWAQGCGYCGEISPFDGAGKLPWKLEWVAKWHVLGVTIEGAGKDHSTKGGSRDVANACLGKIFSKKSPLNIPYEFFLVEGAKMSSSRGIGAMAGDMAEFLPPEILRFLMLRTQPNRPVNFSPQEKHIIKVFNEYDRFRERYFSDLKMPEEEKRVFELSQVGEPTNAFEANFQLVVTFTQMPHLDTTVEIEKRKGSPLSPLERQRLNRRIQAAQYWVEHFAAEEERTRLQESLPARARELSAAQRAFLHRLADALADTDWEDDALQAKIFEVTRMTPIRQPVAFQAIYCVLLDRDSGPKAGNLLAVLDRDFVIRRFRELDYAELDFIRETAIPMDELERWLSAEASRITTFRSDTQLIQLTTDDNAREVEHLGVVNVIVSFRDGKTFVKRLTIDRLDKSREPKWRTAIEFREYGRSIVDRLTEACELHSSVVD